MVGVAASAVVFAGAGGVYFISNQPKLSPGGFASYAHMQPLPDGGRPRRAAAAARGFVPNAYVRERGAFPVAELRAAVAEALGTRARPLTLSYDESIFAYETWPAYIAVAREASNALARWDDRFAELRRLAAAPDLASARSRFGTIEVFVLRLEGRDLVWRSMQGAAVRFRVEMFMNGFAVRELPGGFVAAIRPRS